MVEILPVSETFRIRQVNAIGSGIEAMQDWVHSRGEIVVQAKLGIDPDQVVVFVKERTRLVKVDESRTDDVVVDDLTS